nr:hypothetical protein [Tanacetum cinerariifolium]
ATGVSGIFRWSTYNGQTVETLIDSKAFDRLHEDDVVSLCCLGILQLVLLGVEDRCHVPDWMLSQPTNIVDKKTYSIFGFTWAFKEQKGDFEEQKRVVEEIRNLARYDKYNFEEQKKGGGGNREETYEQMRNFMEGKKFAPVRQVNKGPIIVSHHYGISDFSEFQSIQTIPNRGRREHRLNIYKQTPYVDLTPTTFLPKKRGDKTKNKVNKANLSPLNLGNTFNDDNEGGDDIMFVVTPPNLHNAAEYHFGAVGSSGEWEKMAGRCGVEGCKGWRETGEQWNGVLNVGDRGVVLFGNYTFGPC